MKVKGTHTESIEVELSNSAIIGAAIEVIKKRHKLENVDCIDKGRMYQMVEHHTSHSWTEQEDRGEPTEDQIKALALIKGLKQNLWG